MKKYSSMICLLVFVLLTLSSCCVSQETPEIVNTPTITPTPKPKVECPQEEVETYLEEIDYILEEWDDTYLVATSTSRMSLAPIIGELQDIKRDVNRLDRPECAGYLSDIVVVAMESDINSLVSFLSRDSDSVVSRKMAGAKKAWEIVDTELENFEESPFDAYMAFNLTSEEIESSLEQPTEFELPDDWKNVDLPISELIFSIPESWETEFYGDESQFIRITSSDGTLKIYGGYMPDGIGDIESDSGRLFSLQTILETSDFNFYLEHSADVEVHALNKAYVVEYSVREDSGDDIIEKILAHIITPEDEAVLLFCETTRDEFAQIELIQIREIFGSIREQN
jgi:hypothetical protein